MKKRITWNKIRKITHLGLAEDLRPRKIVVDYLTWLMYCDERKEKMAQIWISNNDSITMNIKITDDPKDPPHYLFYSYDLPHETILIGPQIPKGLEYSKKVDIFYPNEESTERKLDFFDKCKIFSNRYFSCDFKVLIYKPGFKPKSRQWPSKEEIRYLKKVYRDWG